MADNKRRPTSTSTSTTTSTPASVSKTVRKQRSRILGTPSTQDLNSKFEEQSRNEPRGEPSPVNEETSESPRAAVSPSPPPPAIPEIHVDESTSKESTPIPPPSTTKTTENEPQEPVSSPASPRRESVWSMWSRKASLDLRPRPSSVANTSTPQPASAAPSIKSSKSLISDSDANEGPHRDQSPSSEALGDAQPPVSDGANDQLSVKSKDDEKKEQTSSWIGWRKPSVTSFKKSIDEEVMNTNDPVKSAASDSVDQPSNDLSTPAQPKDRASSWSLWSNSNTTNTTTERPSLSNILLSGDGEAILFEPTTTKDDDKNSARNSTHPSRLPNRVVPDFEKALPPYTTTASIINNINRLRYTLGFDVEDPKHLYRTANRPSGIKKVLIIGVHGFFPTKVLRPLIGEPTGTSIKFANEAEKAVWRWAKREGIDVTVQKLALEKEGKIFERVEYFYEVMKKWKDDVEDADYIYFAAHSQGSPVSIILLSRLIEDGIISLQGKRISLLCMAGINNGPFYGADQKLFVRAYSTIESDSLMELFQFQNFDSVHSRELLQALRTVIAHNVKITFVGSINDQLVPLYSSTCLHVRHPNIFRSTYIDGSSKTPEFVTRTVGIANHLHNVGMSDHGVIKEISNSLAGPLTGGGHSRIYNDPQVYDLAINFSLYTSDLKYQIPLHFKPYVIDQLGINPYHLPWCMRGLLFEARAHFQNANDDIDQLFEEFERWKPETKQLKEMKYRLNGIKSKL